MVHCYSSCSKLVHSTNVIFLIGHTILFFLKNFKMVSFYCFTIGCKVNHVLSKRELGVQMFKGKKGKRKDEIQIYLNPVTHIILPVALVIEHQHIVCVQTKSDLLSFSTKEQWSAGHLGRVQPLCGPFSPSFKHKRILWRTKLK